MMFKNHRNLVSGVTCITLRARPTRWPGPELRRAFTKLPSWKELFA
jgi:hypothetical protein